METNPPRPSKDGSTHMETHEMVENAVPSGSEKPVDAMKNELDDIRDERVTAKAWLCVFLLSLSFGVPFWGTPTTPYIAAPLLERFGQPQLSSWVVPCITTAATITILLFSTNSDLFGRRPFLLFSNLINAVAYAVIATSKNPYQLIAGLCLNGCGSGTAGVALIACPELLPNKFRHIGVVLADGFVYLMIIIGPIVARAAINHDDDRWKYIYWAGFIISCVAFTGLAFLYYPPKHPRGVPWRDALRGLDWVGALLFTPGAVMVLDLLVAITYTTYVSASDKRVIICFVLGFAFIIGFGLWEQFSGVKYPLCPTSVFQSHRGREFTAPFCLSFIVVGFFYGLAVIYPSMLNAFYYDATTSVSEQMLLTLPPNLGLPFGAMLLIAFGNKIGHWRWTLIGSVFSLVLWGSLLALITPYNKTMMIAFVSLGQISYGWAAYLAVTFTQLGVPQEYLGISGGLAGLARYAGGAVASASYSSAIGNGIKKRGMELIPSAALGAGFPESAVDELTSAVIAGGPAVLSKLDQATPPVVDAVTTAYKWSAAYGLRNAALASLAFGVVGIALAFACEDIEPKMTPKIEVFLENDALAEKNKHH
ncbi:Fc.00g045720.m01.CDS01 [Cosmosporella sp. VM-42]